MILDLFFLIGLFALIGLSARLAINSLFKLSVNLRLSRFLIGFFVLGVFSSTPEMLVAINSAINQIPNLSLGNLIGAQVVLLPLVAGISVFLTKRVDTLTHINKPEFLFIATIIVMPIILGANGVLSGLDGFLMLALFAAYLIWMLLKNIGFIFLNHHEKSVSGSGKPLIYLTFALVALIIASNYAVKFGHSLATSFGFSDFVIGVLLFSIGTNLPELAFTFSARSTERESLVLGDIIGSAAVNSLIIGLLAFLSPFSIRDTNSFFLSAAILVLIMGLFGFFVFSERILSKKEAALLIFFYVLFIFSLLILR